MLSKQRRGDRMEGMTDRLFGDRINESVRGRG